MLNGHFTNFQLLSVLRCEVFHGRSPEVTACLVMDEQTLTDCLFHGRAALMHCYTHVYHANTAYQSKLPRRSRPNRSKIFKTPCRNQVGTNVSTTPDICAEQDQTV